MNYSGASGMSHCVAQNFTSLSGQLIVPTGTHRTHYVFAVHFEKTFHCLKHMQIMRFLYMLYCNCNVTSETI